jgi:hypothetical protein
MAVSAVCTINISIRDRLHGDRVNLILTGAEENGIGNLAVGNVVVE